jgi:hypothetical protein
MLATSNTPVQVLGQQAGQQGGHQRSACQWRHAAQLWQLQAAGDGRAHLAQAGAEVLQLQGVFNWVDNQPSERGLIMRVD